MRGSSIAPSGIVTLTTDFGTADGYVGAMKGVLLSRAPGLAVHDVAHAIAPQDVAHGAAALRTACPWFPAGTVHVGVVDPGVGTERAAIVVEAGGHVFVGPDNGLFTLVVDVLGGIDEARRIDRNGGLAAWIPELVSLTFHGRDVFAPTAAALASGGLALAEVGPLHEPMRLATAEVSEDDRGVVGCVTHVDHFGNAVTGIPATRLPGLPTVRWEAEVAGRVLPVVPTYGAVAIGEACALAGSEGFVEIAVRGGNAATTLGLATGARVRVSRATSG